MKPSIVRQVGRAEQVSASERRIHTFFRNPGETQEMVDAQIREKIASGEASPHDRFVTFYWKNGEEG